MTSPTSAAYTTTKSVHGVGVMTSSAWRGSRTRSAQGRPCVYGYDDVPLLVKTVTEEPSKGATYGTTGGGAQGVPISASLVLADLQGFGPEPWQVER